MLPEPQQQRASTHNRTTRVSARGPRVNLSEFTPVWSDTLFSTHRNADRCCKSSVRFLSYKLPYNCPTFRNSYIYIIVFVEENISFVSSRPHQKPRALYETGFLLSKPLFFLSIKMHMPFPEKGSVAVLRCFVIFA